MSFCLRARGERYNLITSIPCSKRLWYHELYYPVFQRIWYCKHVYICGVCTYGMLGGRRDHRSQDKSIPEMSAVQGHREVMKTEVITYQTLADSIRPLVERNDGNGKDTFEMSDLWKSNCAKLPAFTYVLRAVLTNSPKTASCMQLSMPRSSTCGNPSRKRHTPSKESRFAVNNRLLITWKQASI